MRDSLEKPTVTRQLGEHLQVGPLVGIGEVAQLQLQVDVARAGLLAYITAVEDNRRDRCEPRRQFNSDELLQQCRKPAAIVIPSQVHLSLFDGALLNATRQQPKPIEGKNRHALPSHRRLDAQATTRLSDGRSSFCTCGRGHGVAKAWAAAVARFIPSHAWTG